MGLRPTASLPRISRPEHSRMELLRKGHSTSRVPSPRAGRGTHCRRRASPGSRTGRRQRQCCRACSHKRRRWKKPVIRWWPNVCKVILLGIGEELDFHWALLCRHMIWRDDQMSPRGHGDCIAVHVDDIWPFEMDLDPSDSVRHELQAAEQRRQTTDGVHHQLSITAGHLGTCALASRIGRNVAHDDASSACHIELSLQIRIQSYRPRFCTEQVATMAGRWHALLCWRRDRREV